jgi:short-subunit dehydrogenase
MAFTLSGVMCEAQSVGENTRRPKALVTGASSGIGEAFAMWYAGRGYDLVIAARNHAELERVATATRAQGVATEVVVADLATPKGIEEVALRCGDVSTIVLNAGSTHAASIGTTDRDELDSLTYLLATGVVRLCEAVVPGMIERGGGDVVIVSSIAAFTPMRKAAPYAAAKSHSAAYARSLSLEVGRKNVRVVAVCPGYVRTDLHRRAGLEHLSTSIPDWMWLSADAVIRAADRALRRGRVVVVPGLVYRLALPFLSSSAAQVMWRRLTRRV